MKSTDKVSNHDKKAKSELSSKNERIKSKRPKFGDKIIPETFEEHVQKTLKEHPELHGENIVSDPTFNTRKSDRRARILEEKRKSGYLPLGPPKKGKKNRSRGARLLEEKRKSGYLPSAGRSGDGGSRGGINTVLNLSLPDKPLPPPAIISQKDEDELPFYSLGGLDRPLPEYRPPPDTLAALTDFSRLKYENYAEIEKKI